MEVIPYGKTPSSKINSHLKIKSFILPHHIDHYQFKEKAACPNTLALCNQNFLLSLE